MADLQHTDLTTLQVHEPKHITGGVTTDTGKVITSSSSVNGESEFRQLAVADIDTTGSNIVPAYGSMTVVNNTNSIPVIAATNPALTDPADYIQILPDTISYSPGLLSNITFATNELTVLEDGIYFFSGWTDIAVVSGNNTLVGLKLTVNGATSAASPSGKSLIPSSSSIINIAASSVVSLSAGDSFGIAIAADRNASLILGDSDLNLVRIEIT